MDPGDSTGQYYSNKEYVKWICEIDSHIKKFRGVFMLARVRKGTILTLVLALVVSMFASVAVAADRTIGLVVDGEQLQPDVPPQMIDNRTLVPVRWVSEALGADIKWDQENNRVLVNSSDDTPVTDSSDIQLIVDGEVLQPDVPPQLIDNRTMVPIRWVSEALGAEI